MRETVDIKAPAARVWAVVQEDAVHAPKWSSNVAKIEKLDGGPPGKGTRYRYHLDLPGGLKETLEVEQTVYLKPKRCAGKFIRGPLKGTWSYTYTESKAGGTHVMYEMDYELGGLLRVLQLPKDHARFVRLGRIPGLLIFGEMLAQLL